MLSCNDGKSEYKVSVVMPVYNSQKYLEECINSVIGQTLKDIQIIFVDDGSTDESLQILKNYSRDNSNILVLETEHIGAANARNAGFSHAKGQYVIFLDSDDLFEKDMLEEMYSAAVKYDADVAVCEWDQNILLDDTDSKSKNQEYYLENVLNKYLRQYSKQPFTLKELPMEGLLLWYSCPWNKLCKKNFLENNNIFFQNLKSANDVYYSCMVMILADKIIHTRSFKSMVHYRKANNEGQISKRRTTNDVYKALEKTYLNLIKINKLDEEIYHRYYIHAFNCIVTDFSAMRGDEEENKKFYDFFAEDGMKNIGLEQGKKKAELGYYRDYINKFQKHSYNSKWFQKENFVGTSLEQKGMEEVANICRKYRVAVWGAGIKGTALIETLNKYNIKILGLIDSALYKQGNVIGGYEIKNFQQLCGMVDIIIITGKDLLGSICSNINRYGEKDIKIMPLFMYLESKYKLEDCIFTIEELERELK